MMEGNHGESDDDASLENIADTCMICSESMVCQTGHNLLCIARNK